MTELVATTPGVYPLPEPAKAELASLKGHQKGDLVTGDEPPAVADAYDRARRDAIDWQRDAGLDRVVEGQLRWDDALAHPLAVHDSVETRGIVRYYDNNNFYRSVHVTGDLDFDGDTAADLDAAADSLSGDPLQAVLPGPYSLADLAVDDHYGDDAEFLAAIAEFLAGEIEALPEHETLFLLEPSLVTSPPGEDVALADAIDQVVGATPADVVVHTYWGALDPGVHGRVLDSAADGAGYDLVNAGDASRDLLAEYGTADQAALGVVAGKNTEVEDPADLRAEVESVLDAVDVDTAYVTADTELFYLPVGRFERKLRALARAAAPETEVTA
jgi:5-methyltetrahydropteroyltriglutamate--homocysteine methyltransferase